MTVLTEGRYTGEFLVSEASGARSRDEITVVAGSNQLGPGRILGKLTASGKYAPYNPEGSDGSQTVAGILYAAVDASGDVQAVAITRDAEVNAAELDWGALNAGQIAAGRAGLVALGIVPRDTYV